MSKIVILSFVNFIYLMSVWQKLQISYIQELVYTVIYTDLKENLKYH